MQEIRKRQGTHADDKSKEASSSGNQGQSAAHWRYAKTDDRAQEKIRRMHRLMLAWKLKECVKLLCPQPPNLMEIAKQSDVCFASVQLVEVASRTVAELASTAAAEAKLSEVGTTNASVGTDATVTSKKV